MNSTKKYSSSMLAFTLVVGLGAFVLSRTSATSASQAADSKGETPMPVQKIVTCLWFKDNAEEAVNFYVSTLKNSRVVSVDRMPTSKPGDVGSVVSMTFELEGQRYMAINGNAKHMFNESISLMVSCQSQDEVDQLWTTLTSNGGAESQCGWLKDRFGVSWQIIPSVLIELMHDKDPAKANRVVQAMLKMQKIDIAKLKEAHAGK